MRSLLRRPSFLLIDSRLLTLAFETSAATIRFDAKIAADVGVPFGAVRLYGMLGSRGYAPKNIFPAGHGLQMVGVTAATITA